MSNILLGVACVCLRSLRRDASGSACPRLPFKFAVTLCGAFTLFRESCDESASPLRMLRAYGWERHRSVCATSFSFHPFTQSNSVIAILFSVLRMSVKDATEEFHKICNEVYVDGLSAAERTERFRKAIVDLLRRRGLPADLKLNQGFQAAEDECPW
jgi:hypothetical protein